MASQRQRRMIKNGVEIASLFEWIFLFSKCLASFKIKVPQFEHYFL